MTYKDLELICGVWQTMARWVLNLAVMANLCRVGPHMLTSQIMDIGGSQTKIGMLEVRT